jgi:tetratricopeptide (TPR) repeat protein
MTFNLLKISTVLFISLFLSSSPTIAQTLDERLAFQYYSSGEYDKAELYFEKVYSTNTSFEIFEPYFNTLLALSKVKDAEKMARKQLKSSPTDLKIYILIGQSLEKQDKRDKAQDEYNTAISKISKTSSYSDINQLAQYFQKFNLNDQAIKTYQAANTAYNNPTLYNANIAVLYGQMGKTELMIETFLDMIEANDNYLTSVQNQITNAIDFEKPGDKVELLKNSVLKRIQANPNKSVYNELLAWVYLSTGNFNGAFTQLRALDKKDNKNGDRVMQLGNTCLNNENFDVAIKCYDFIIEIGNSSKNFSAAKAYKLRALKLKLTKGGNFTQEELVALKKNYEITLETLGWNAYSISTIQDLANLEAYYLNNSERAIDILNRALQYAGIDAKTRAQMKVQLGDVKVLSGDIWDASLLFMQVEMDFKEDPIGHEAKFKAAKIFYYTGNFEWAQAQLDVLKASTSKLISNDAMQLSMTISDNYNMDTTQVTMMLFARADLLIQQHQFTKANQTFDSINKIYPIHSLNDEILIKRAEIAVAQQKYEEAITHLEEIILKYGNDILADDAVYRIAQIYEYNLQNTEKAAEYYKKIVFDYKGSLYGVEAREKYRKYNTGTTDSPKIIK